MLCSTTPVAPLRRGSRPFFLHLLLLLLRYLQFLAYAKETAPAQRQATGPSSFPGWSELLRLVERATGSHVLEQQQQQLVAPSHLADRVTLRLWS